MSDPNSASEWQRPRYSRSDAETMMCLLDAWRDIEDADQERRTAQEAMQRAMGSHDPEEYPSFFLDFRSNNGSYDLRQTLEQMAPDVGKLWDSLSDDQWDKYIFDWEFYREVLRHAVDWGTRDGNCKVKLFEDAKERILAHRTVRETFGGRAA